LSASSHIFPAWAKVNLASAEIRNPPTLARNSLESATGLMCGPLSSKRDETACLRVLVRHSNRPMIRAATGSLRLCEKLTVQQPVPMGFARSFSCGNPPQIEG
jgi:hypothetical protein